MEVCEHTNRDSPSSDKVMNLGSSHSAEKQDCTVLAMESRLGPSTQGKAEHLTAATGHTFE